MDVVFYSEIYVLYYYDGYWKRFTILDIEKRKSFADMKLAEVATGGSQPSWTFENLPEEPSTPCDDEIVSSAQVDPDSCKNGDHNNENGENMEPEQADIENATSEAASDMHCNGHEETGNAASTAFKNGSGDNQEMASPAAASNAVRPPALSSTVTENKPDPVTEIAPDLQVKIADLGNACWVVRLHKHFLIFPILGHIDIRANTILGEETLRDDGIAYRPNKSKIL